MICGICAAAWGYFYLKQTKKPSLNAIEVLPANAICVLSSSNFHELSNKLCHQNLIWNEMSNIPEIKDLHNQIQYFDSLTSEVELVKEFFENRLLYASLYDEGWLICFNLKDVAHENDFKEALTSALKCEFNSNGEAEFWNGTEKYCIITSEGVAVVSKKKELAKRCFNRQEKKLYTNKSFHSLIKNLNSDDLLNVYINHSLFEQSIKKVKSENKILNGHTVCNFEITPVAITANGFNECDSSSILNYLSGQPTTASNFFQQLPFNTVSYNAYSISDYPALSKKFLPISGHFWKRANDSAMYNVQRQIEENIGNFAVETEFKLNNSFYRSLLVEIKDSALVKEALKFTADSITYNDGIKMFIHCDSTSGLSSELFRDLFETKGVYTVVFGNYLILSDNIAASEYYLQSLLNNSSLLQNESFMTYAKENLMVEFNYQAYCSVDKQNKKVQDIFTFIADSSLKYTTKISNWSTTVTNYKNLLQFRTCMSYKQTSQSSEIPGLWICETDTCITSGPYAFVNHKSGENELLIMDAKNSLYLVNATGNVLWKKSIGEKPVSDLFTVDAYKNSKYQILFCTSNFLHLIDRNGEYVQGFPVKLPSLALGVSLFDYDNTKDYRIIISCADSKIYNYNVNGTKNEKFTPIKTNEVVKIPVKYVKAGASDYLIACDKEGKVYTYSRRGEGRLDLTNRLLADCNDFYMEVSNSILNTKIIYFDAKNSLLEKIGMSDTKDLIKLGAEFEQAKNYFELIDDDKKTDIVILDKSKLLCYDFSGNEIFRFESETGSYSDASYYFDEEGAYFLLNSVNGEIHILQVADKKITGKIKGNGKPFIKDLFKDGKKYLIVSENNRLKCVLFK